MAIYLTESDVAELLSMEQVLQAVEAAHVALSRGEVVDIPRARARNPRSMLHILQASWPAKGVMGYKAYTTSSQGARFWVHLFDSANGSPLAMIEADLLGMMRTGAASAIASCALARKDSRRMTMFGCGWQAEGQLRAHAAAMPQLVSFHVFARDQPKLHAFCTRMSALIEREVVPVQDLQQALAASDIVVTATTSPNPLFEASLLPEGVHLNAVGSNSLIRRELDERTVLRFDLICVDSIPTALLEAGDLLPLLEKGRLHSRQILEIGDILCGKQHGRQEARDLTLFESQGMAIQDLAVAVELFERAKTAGIGKAMPY